MRTPGSTARCLLLCALVPQTPCEGQEPVPVLHVTTRWETLGDPVSGEWGGITGAALTAPGGVWIMDQLLGRVVEFTPPDRFRLIADRGDGPGEVRGPAVAAVADDGSVVVLDIGRASLEWFDARGRFTHRTRLARAVRSPKGMVVTRDRGILISGGMDGSDRGVHRFGADTGELEWSAVEVPGRVTSPQALRHILGGALARGAADTVMAALSSPARLLRVDAASGAVAHVLTDERWVPFVGDGFLRPGSTPQGFVRYWWSYPRVTGLIPVGDGRHVMVATFEEEYRSVWRLVNRAGVPVAEWVADRPYEVLAVGRGGDVLATYRRKDTDEPVVTMLKVRVGRDLGPGS